jgi:CRISPR-associated endonuclease/helicase Cas3
MRLVRRIDMPAPEDDEDAEEKTWLWFARPNSADDDGSKSAKEPITWDHHTKDVTCNATRIADALFRDQSDLHTALVLAAKFHDLGKMRVVWQRSIGNPNPTNWHAKSGRDPKTRRVWKPLELTDYRHEFGSLLDLVSEQEFQALKDRPEVRDLILHLVAVHHGYGRPHFPADKVFDPKYAEAAASDVAREVPRRFARLQRKYGRWGLAYLESLLRAADYAASAVPSEFYKGGAS